ncbi:hypothetical protein H8356DRAFT_1423861 [Neocallimastix lanati (nom. inval.)]|nr:hypothetical protein H8356DRAFT_1423861 [Neocallimastix sp. JGI-2020a]
MKDTNVNLWHRRLDHFNIDMLLFKAQEFCLFIRTSNKTNDTFELIHMDLASMTIQDMGGSSRENEAMSLIFRARESENKNVVKYLEEHVAIVNKEDDKVGNEAAIKYLIEFGYDLYGKEKFGISPLHRACFRRKETIIKYLVEHEVDVTKCKNN